MMYADPTFEGNIKWLTLGTAAIPQWRYNLAMLLAFPGVILYGAALFAVQEDIKYMKEFFLDTLFGKYPNLGHAGLVLLRPELFAKKMRELFVRL